MVAWENMGQAWSEWEYTKKAVCFLFNLTLVTSLLYNCYKCENYIKIELNYN